MSLIGRYADNDMQSVDARALLNGHTAPEKATGRALTALHAYADLDGVGGSPEEIARDLITDLLHLGDAFGFLPDWVDLATDEHNYESRRELTR